MTSQVQARRKHKDTVLGYLCISPWILGLLILTLGPILASIYFSFTKYGLIGQAKWVGLDNYVRIFTRDRLFWKSLSVTFYYSLTSVPLGLIFGLALALLLNEKVKLLGVFRTIYYLPAVLSGVAVGSISWRSRTTSST